MTDAPTTAEQSRIICMNLGLVHPLAEQMPNKRAQEIKSEVGTGSPYEYYSSQFDTYRHNPMVKDAPLPLWFRWPTYLSSINSAIREVDFAACSITGHRPRLTHNVLQAIIGNYLAPADVLLRMIWLHAQHFSVRDLSSDDLTAPVVQTFTDLIALWYDLDELTIKFILPGIGPGFIRLIHQGHQNSPSFDDIIDHSPCLNDHPLLKRFLEQDNYALVYRI